MPQFQIVLLFVVAKLLLLQHALAVMGDEEVPSKKDDMQRHRAKRWLWDDSGCGLIPGCDECTDGLLCKTCKQSFIPVEYERNRKIIIRCTRSCPVGFNITSRQGYSRICIRTELGRLNKIALRTQILEKRTKPNSNGCTARNCDDCHQHSPVSCANCTQGYYSLQKKIMGNVRCVKNCPIGFTPSMDSDGKKLCKDTQSKCKPIVPNCAKCLDSLRCRKCRNAFHAFFNKSGMVCVRKCPKGLVPFNSSYFGKYCKKPLAECRYVANCARCPDKINCRRCKPRYFKIKISAFHNSTCVVSCPRGFAKKGRRCQRITEDGCAGEYCLTCKEGWFRINYNKRRCQRKCPKGFYTYRGIQNYCLKCSDNCEKCSNGYDCLKCNSETSSLKAPGLRTTCVKSCPLGYTKQGDRAKGKSCQLIKRNT